jgi:hypothetical protein
VLTILAILIALPAMPISLKRSETAPTDFNEMVVDELKTESMAGEL